MQRALCESEEDRHLRPSDGRLTNLVVQAVDEVYNLLAQSTWRRTFIKSVSPTTIQVANRAADSIPVDLSQLSLWDWVKVVGK